jgi:ferredoxin
LPRETLDGEIAVILALGIEMQAGKRLGEETTLDELRDQFDAVLLACGATDKKDVEAWGLEATSRGVVVNKGTFETNLPGVFAAGNALRGKGMVVRSVADGKEAAGAIGQYLEGKPIVPVGRPFSSRIGKLQEGEMDEFLASAADGPGLDRESAEPGPLSLPIASHQAHRCLNCGCAAQGNCKLERYAIMYGAETARYQSDRRAFVQVNRTGSVIYEPGKCINCELCIKIAAESSDALGLTFVGRGFDVRVGVPFDGTMEEALGDVAAKCIAACPTGALYLSPVHTLVDLEEPAKR